MGKHYVPQEYLRGFSPSADQRDIWMFDKASRGWSLAAIKRVAQTKHYYSADIEARLASEVETPGHDALNALRRGENLALTQRRALAHYIAVLVMRGPRKRRKGRELVPKVLEDTVSEARSDLEELRTEANAARIDYLLSEVDRIEKVYRVEAPSTVQEQIESPWPSSQVIAAVEGMAWRIAKAPANTFLVTTDNPGYFFESYGLGTDNAELTFPIDATTALLGSHQGTPGSTISFLGKPALVKEVNRRVASGAERFVFSPRRARWIETLAMRSNPYLSRIEW